jgi:hypothetical protein
LTPGGVRAVKVMRVGPIMSADQNLVWNPRLQEHPAVRRGDGREREEHEEQASTQTMSVAALAEPRRLSEASRRASPVARPASAPGVDGTGGS